jgi:hypothetical protein
MAHFKLSYFMVRINSQIIPSTSSLEGASMAVAIPVVPKPDLSVKDARGNPSSTIPLDIKASTTVFVSGLPEEAKLSGGTKSGPGTWTLQPTDLNDLTLTLPPGYSTHLTLQVIAKDDSGATTQKVLAVQIGPAEFTPGTTSEKRWVFSFLLVAAILVLSFWFWQVRGVQGLASAEVSVPWDRPIGVALKPGPPSFRYDSDSKKLFFRGLMDATQKEELVKLVPSGGADSQTAGAASYQGAIDQLAYVSDNHLDSFILRIFLLGGVSGILGVLMRSLFNFVRICCVENKFDWHRWWPWYVTRPILGFFLGLVCVLFVQADLFQPSGKSSAGLAWWLGIALLAGFASDDFVEKIRLIGQTLFGNASASSQTNQKPTTS